MGSRELPIIQLCQRNMQLYLAALIVLGLVLSSQARGKPGGKPGGGPGGKPGGGPGGKPGKPGKFFRGIKKCFEDGGPLNGFECTDGKARPVPIKTCLELTAGMNKTDLRPPTRPERPCADAPTDTSFSKSGSWVCMENGEVVDPYVAAEDCRDWNIAGECEQMGTSAFWKPKKDSITCT